MTVLRLQALHLQLISIVNNHIISWCDGVDWDKYATAPHRFQHIMLVFIMAGSQHLFLNVRKVLYLSLLAQL